MLKVKLLVTQNYNDLRLKRLLQNHTQLGLERLWITLRKDTKKSLQRKNGIMYLICDIISYD